jgi:hypothetical protein
MPANTPQIAQGVKQSSLAKLYPDVNWEVLFRKVGKMNSQDYDWSEAVTAIATPTMLVFADADAIRLDQMIEFYKQLGGGQRDAGLDGSLRSATQLAIVSGATHYDILSTTAVSNLVAPFLDAPSAVKR